MDHLHAKQLYPKPGLASLAMIALASVSVLDSAEAASRHSRNSENAAQESLSREAVLAIVSIKDQNVTVYDADGGSMRARVSSGRTGYETPVGVYSVLQKKEEHYSNLYDDASMPYMQRITWSGVALHGGALPGYPASHGCVRLPESFARRIFPLTKIGMRVVVSYDDVAPVEISHPLLLKPTPPPAIESAVPIAMSYHEDVSSDEGGGPFEPNVKRWPARLAQLEALKSVAAGKQIEADSANSQADEMKQIVAEKKEPRDKAAKALRKAEAAKKVADDKVARADKGLAGAKSPKTVANWEAAKAKAMKAAEETAAKVAALSETLAAAEAELQIATDQAAPYEAARAAAVAQASEAKRKTQPVSIFISLKTQKLYVRQGHEPVLEAPVTISEPERPIGTHVYTAVDYTKDGKDLRWTAVTLEHRGTNYASSDDRLDQANDAEGAPQTEAARAAAALDRITIEPDVLERVAEAAWPGTSLIVSDEPMSKETSKATDFVVLISTEPQGGIKKRPKQFFRYDNYYRDSSEDFYYNYDRNGRRQYYPRQKPLFWW